MIKKSTTGDENKSMPIPFSLERSNYLQIKYRSKNKIILSLFVNKKSK